jgi:intracellular sulfur oxidation DsrE/DsrF family protein
LYEKKFSAGERNYFICLSFVFTKKESMPPIFKDSARLNQLKAMAYYPVFNAGLFSSVLPVDGVDEIPDPNKDYKLLFKFTVGNSDSTHKSLSPGLVEIPRIINLHVASGIPISHIHIVVATHGPSMYALETNDGYRKKFGIDNPNIRLIQQLMLNGTKFIACGQAMHLFLVDKADLYPGTKVSLTAQTVLSNYAEQGYVWYKIDQE